MRKNIVDKINKVNNALFNATAIYDDLDKSFDIEVLRNNIDKKYKLTFGEQQANQYKLEIKGFSIYLYASKKDKLVYLEVIPMVGKNNELNEHFALWLGVEQTQKFLRVLAR